ncbi:MAG: phenylalanine--tRNA ligase subunit alpha [Spirochaetes bacterium GWF1_31_7]|nr:MAG: phenylalanine--tRNA ligase subunit alpha [Spirochaetes bacterium GWE1_32_154]OHD48990.1 MAG: phenylalanine--tRNA ligase subunit alpha [Spirochaetes bacterium GWE2_31_10]OHD49570.1 MAG: phenylalanine--tRNA ligase subunit alpha [Spirochaetes bacterium GWF1_31_7]HBD95914.1 phenylalanine--tRNA ligase subunit alpha [Spirochaetia bacterium]HBI36740.1 phenylalanine--tRNA ligase subunit alpha [Spirochaetia bacterium]
MIENIDKIKATAIELISKALSTKELEEIRVNFLGKKGELTSVLKTLGSLSVEDRPKAGALVNEAKNSIEQILDETISNIKNKELNTLFLNEKIDITLPGRRGNKGSKHPLRKVLEEIEEIFLGLGFSIEEGPEIDTDFNTFKALNFQDDHPARDSQDTLYVNKDILFRTHTSPVQIRTMNKMHPEPVRIICPGRVYRRDAIDPTHSPQFHQVEGLIVDKDVQFSDLIGTLEIFAKKLFGETKKIRVRPSFFPFTEPSAEVDVTCIFCDGKGCGFCKHTGWLEVLGAGAVHPNVLRMSGYDPEIYTGFAFGMGLDRITALKYRVNDIRYFFENDIRFLKQFN